MSQRFQQVLSEASSKVKEWPEWKKSEALKLSERSVAGENERSNQQSSKQNVKKAGA